MIEPYIYSWNANKLELSVKLGIRPAIGSMREFYKVHSEVKGYSKWKTISIENPDSNHNWAKVDDEVLLEILNSLVLAHPAVSLLAGYYGIEEG